MLERCTATTKAGAPCTAQAWRGGLCRWHSPEGAEDRAAWRRKGGAGKATAARARKALGEASDLTDVQAVLYRALGKVERGELDPAQAQAMASLGRAIVAVAVPGELARRVEELERAAGGRAS